MTTKEFIDVVSFWRWPKLVRKLSKELTELEAKHEALKIEHEKVVSGQVKLIEWIKVTHRLHRAPEGIRLLIQQGRRIVPLLFLFLCQSLFAQPFPPILRQPLTTNSHFGPTPTEGQVPTWNAAAKKWSNNVPAGAAATPHTWTNDNGTLKPIAFPTNILLRVNVPDDGIGTNFYFDSRVNRTNAHSKLFTIQNGGSNALTVGPDGGLFMGRGNTGPFPGVVLYGLYDTALGETNQQEIFTLSGNSAVGYSGAADLIIDTNYGALILFANKEGGVKFTRFSIQAGAGDNPQNFNSFTMQALVDGATYMQMDPNFTLLTRTNYLFSSSIRITNTDILLSLQNSNFPVLEVDGVGDLRLIKKIPYLWPSSQGAAGTALTNNGSGALGWWPISAGAGPPGLTTNVNQLLGVPLSIKDGAFLTNINVQSSLEVSNGWIYASGPVTNGTALNLPHLTVSRSAIINAQGDVTNSSADSNWSLYTTNVWNSRQGGSLTLSNLAGTGAITNLFTDSLSNATVKPLVIGIGNAAGATNTTGAIRGLEAGANITITANGSNYVIAATVSGSGITTNENQFGPSVVLTIKDGALLTNLIVETSLKVSNGFFYAVGPVTNGTELNLPHLTVSRSAIINAQGDLTNSTSDSNWSLYTTNVWNDRQFGSENLTNWSNIPTGAMANVVSTTFLTNWANAISNLAETKQFGSAVLTNLVSTVGKNVTNFVSLSTTNATSKPLTNSYTAGTLTMFGIEQGSGQAITMNASNIVVAIDWAQTASTTNVVGVSNWVNSVSNLVQTKQSGSAVLSNLVSTVANNVTNVVSLSTTNATSKPLTNSYTSGVLTIFGIEQGSGQAITMNASNIVSANDWAQTASTTNVVGVSNWVNSVSNLVQTKQNGSAVLTNLVSTVANNVTNVVSLSTTNATSKPLTNAYANGVLTLFGIEQGSGLAVTMSSNIVIANDWAKTASTTNVVGVSNWVNSVSNLAQTKQFGSSTLTNLSGTGAITNLFSQTLSNATIKPLVVGIGNAAAATNTTGEIRGLEAGANITITPNGSNYVIAGPVGFADLLWTNEPSGRIHPVTFTNRVELQRVLTIGTNTATFFVAGNSNDFLLAGRDITKGERWAPQFSMGAFSNSVASYEYYTFDRLISGQNFITTDENGASSTVTIIARASGGLGGDPEITLTTTNSYVPFSSRGATNTILNNVTYQFPTSQGAAGTILTNDGNGALGWGIDQTSAGASGLSTNANQFLGIPLSIKDTALLTNTVNFKTLLLTNAPGGGSGSLTLAQTNGRGYTQITIPDNNFSTNQLVLAIGSNTVTSSQVLKIHSASIAASGVNTITVTNDVDSGGTNYPGMVTFGWVTITNSPLSPIVHVTGTTNLTLTWGKTNHYVFAPTNQFQVWFENVPQVGFDETMYVQIQMTNATMGEGGLFPTNHIDGLAPVVMTSPSTNNYMVRWNGTNAIWIASGQELTTGVGPDALQTNAILANVAVTNATADRVAVFAPTTSQLTNDTITTTQLRFLGNIGNGAILTNIAGTGAITNLIGVTNAPVLAAGNLHVTNQLLRVSENFNGGTVFTNLDFTGSILKVMTNAITGSRTNNLTNAVGGASMLVYVVGDTAAAADYNYTFAAAGGASIRWMNAPTNSDTVSFLVHSNAAYFIRFDVVTNFAGGATNITARWETDSSRPILNRLLPVSAGAGTSNAWVGGSVYGDFLAHTNHTGTDNYTNLVLFTVPANTLTNNGDKMSFKMAGNFRSAFATTNSLKMQLGTAAAMETGYVTASNCTFEAYLDIVRTATSVQRANCKIYWATNLPPGQQNAGPLTVTATNMTLALDTGVTNIFVFQGKSRVIGGLTNTWFTVDWTPGPRGTVP